MGREGVGLGGKGVDRVTALTARDANGDADL